MNSYEKKIEIVNTSSPNYDAAKSRKIRGTLSYYDYDKKATNDMIFKDINKTVLKKERFSKRKEFIL